MKKFLSLVLALVLGVIGINLPAAMADVSTKTETTVTLDTPTAVKADEWVAGYKLRCRRYRRHTSRQKKMESLNNTRPVNTIRLQMSTLHKNHNPPR